MCSNSLKSLFAVFPFQFGLSCCILQSFALQVNWIRCSSTPGHNSHGLGHIGRYINKMMFAGGVPMYSKFTILNSKFTILNSQSGSQFTIHSSQFSIRVAFHNSQFTIINSQFLVHNSQFLVHNSQFLVQNSQCTILPPWGTILNQGRNTKYIWRWEISIRFRSTVFRCDSIS